MDSSAQKRQAIAVRFGARFAVQLAMAAVSVCSLALNSQDISTLKKMDLGIIVVPTMQAAQSVLKQLNGGADFSVLAKEKSIDASASDGGYLGKLQPGQLRPELQNALRGRRVGELTEPVHLPSGFAILKVFPVAPPTSDLNPKRIMSLLASGAIRYGAQVSGLVEANAAFVDYPKQAGWNRDIQKVCQIRKASLSAATVAVQANLTPDRRDLSVTDRILGYSLLAQLYAYSGEMEKSISEWKVAYGMAKTAEPHFFLIWKRVLALRTFTWPRWRMTFTAGQGTWIFFLHCTPTQATREQTTPGARSSTSQGIWNRSPTTWKLNGF